MSEEDYNDAVSWLGGAPAAASLPNEQKLELYGIFKTLSTGGAPTASRPGMFSFEGRAKWDAWAAAAAKYAEDEDAARGRYLEIATSVGFEPGQAGGQKTGMGPSVSVMTAEEDTGEKPSPIHDAAASGAVNDLKAILVLDPAQVDLKDEFGFTPLHLAADRGHAGAVEYLLSRGADRTVLDPDGQTALDVANMLGRDDIVALLQ